MNVDTASRAEVGSVRRADVPVARPSRDDQLDILACVLALAQRKYTVFSCAAVAGIVGLLIAWLHGPRFVSEALIAPVEREQGGFQVPTLGALSGLRLPTLLAGAQHNSVDQIELVLTSREFGETLVERYALLPALVRMRSPREYRKWYDEEANVWREGFAPPRRLEMGEYLREEVLEAEIRENNTIHIAVVTPDSTFSDSLMSYYLVYLNEYIRKTVQEEARQNVEYLYERLDGVSDPLVREKLQEMIASEVEREMLVARGAFNVVESGYRKTRWAELITYPIGFAMLATMLSVSMVLLGLGIKQITRSERDRHMLHAIRLALQGRTDSEDR